MQKKIAIVSFQNADNYGAVLQHFALQRAIERLGHEAVSVDVQCGPLEEGYKPVIFPREKHITMKQWLRFVVKNIINFQITKQHSRAFSDFRKEWFITTGRIHMNQLCSLDSKYDLFICGSDQVWNEKITGREFAGVFSLAFVTKAKKASYGASLGNVSDIKGELLENIKRLDYITVREGSFAKSLEDKLKHPVSTVCDPVLLWDRNAWDLFINGRMYKGREDHFLFLYFNDCPQACEIVRYIKNRKNDSVICPCTRNKFSMNDGFYSYGEDPFEFVARIRDADFVVATSFHATVFSIVYEKCFISIPSGGDDKRLNDILERLNLSERLVADLADYKARAEELETIDYTFARKELEDWRERSLGELKFICEL